MYNILPPWILHIQQKSHLTRLSKRDPSPSSRLSCRHTPGTDFDLDEAVPISWRSWRMLELVYMYFTSGIRDAKQKGQTALLWFRPASLPLRYHFTAFPGATSTATQSRSRGTLHQRVNAIEKRAKHHRGNLSANQGTLWTEERGYHRRIGRMDELVGFMEGQHIQWIGSDEECGCGTIARKRFVDVLRYRCGFTMCAIKWGLSVGFNTLKVIWHCLLGLGRPASLSALLASTRRPCRLLCMTHT